MANPRGDHGLNSSSLKDRSIFPFMVNFAPEVLTAEERPFCFETSFAPDSFNDERGSVDVVWYAGAKVYRSGGWCGEPYYLILSMDPKHIRQDRLKSGRMAVLDSHGPEYSNPRIGDIIGRVEDGRVADGQGLGTIVFSANSAGQEAKMMSKHGDLPNLSIGTRIWNLTEITEPGDKIPTFLADDHEPQELSMLPIGADVDAAVLSSQDANPVQVNYNGNSHLGATAPKPKETMTRAQILALCIAAGLTEAFCDVIISSGELSQEEVESQIAAKVAAEALEAAPANPGAPTPAPVQSSAAELAAATAAGAAAERTRHETVVSRALLSGLTQEFATTLANEGLSIDVSVERIFAALTAGQQLADGGDRLNPHMPTRITREEGAGESLAIENLLMNRFNPSTNELTEQAQEFMGFSLLDLACNRAERFGIQTRGLNKSQRAALAFHSTSDFPEILANIARRTLRAGYEEAPRTFMSLSRQVTINDFKPVSRVQLGEAPILELVGEGGEVTSGTMGESKETYALQTYAKNFKVTRRVIIDDDLDAFSRMPSLFGASAAAMENTLAWALLTTGANGVNMGDGLDVFAAGHNNTGTGILAQVGLSDGRKTLRRQTGQSGRPLNLAMRWLITPASLETQGQSLMVTNLNPNKPADVNPIAAELDGMIVEPLLDIDSESKWYAAARPGQIDILEHGYLEGQSGPSVETIESKDTLGFTIQALEDFAVAVIDWRGLYRSSGV